LATPDGKRPGEAFFARPPITVAYDLLGCLLVSDRPPAPTAGRIVEVEAYAGVEDLASHAGKYAAGRAAMFGRPGRTYVYRSYGIHAMLNVVAHGEGEVGAVLIRALEPIEGSSAMILRRGRDSSAELCNGPGRLCQALDIRLADDGLNLEASNEIWIEHGSPPGSILCSERIGISKGREAHWRLFVGDNRFVSPPRRGRPCDPARLPILIPDDS
jgi:DNA-3-methyladenine glycosylase